MDVLKLILTIIHALGAVALIVIVLLQSGKQQGLSGAISGGAETFFGKNKGRTVDAMLGKFTAVVAIIFLITSVSLAIFLNQPSNTTNIDIPQIEGDAFDDEASHDHDGDGIPDADHGHDEEGNIIPIEELPLDGDIIGDGEPLEGEIIEGEVSGDVEAPADNEVSNDPDTAQ